MTDDELVPQTSPNKSDPVPTTATGKPIFPYRNEDQVHQDMRRFAQRQTRQTQRHEIMLRLEASGPLGRIAAVELVESFPRQDMSMRHEILDFLQALADQDIDISNAGEALARYLNDSNFALREKVAEVLLRMGEGAHLATTRVLGCTRHGVREIRLAAVKILGNIGPHCAAAAGPRLKAMQKSVPDNDTEMRDALQEALDQLYQHGHEGEHADSEAREQSTKEIRSEIGVLRLIERIASGQKHIDDRSELIAILQKLPEEARIKGLVICLASKDVLTRALAAWAMTQEFELFIPYAPTLKKAFQSESDMRVRCELGDLLTAMLCYVSLEKQTRQQAN